MSANKVLVSFSIELNSIEELTNLLSIINANKKIVHASTSGIKEDKQVKEKKEVAVQQVEEEVQPAEEKKEVDVHSEVTISDLRALLLEKVNDHRSEIREKLTELGAPNVTSLEESKYEELYNYLNSL